MQIIRKYLNKFQIIPLILAPITFIIYLIYPNSNFNHLTWICLIFSCLGNLYFLNKWHKEGITWFRKADSKFDKRITRKPADTCMFIIMAQFFYLCLLILLFDYDSLISNNILTIVNYIIFIIIIAILILITDTTNKKIMEFIPKKK